MSKASLTIVVIGGVAGGASAAARARRCDEHANIILLERDSYVSFANCGLPYYIGGEITERDKLLVATPELFRTQFKIDVRTRHEVTSIDRTRKTVAVQDRDAGHGYELAYDKLIVTPGAAPIVPPIPHAQAANVFTLRNLDDTDAIKSYIERAKVQRAVVVGAGFIGLEMVEQLRRLDIEVALVELAPQVLVPLDPEMARPLEEVCRVEGVELYLGQGIESIDAPDGPAHAVTTSAGNRLHADMVIMGIGVRPNAALAEAAGLALGSSGGISINAHCQTSDPDIYAVGDSVEYMHGVLQRPVRIPLAGPANRGGRIAGEHAATGKATPMTPPLGTAIVRVFDKAAGITGLSSKAAKKAGIDARSVIIAAGNHAGYFPGAQTILLKLVYAPDTGKVLGAQACGGEGVDKRIDVIATAISLGASVDDLAGLDLAYAPPFGSAKDPVHIAAFVAQNDLAHFAEITEADASLEGWQVLDVRNQDEVDDFALPDIMHIPLPELRARLGELDKSMPLVVTCHSGKRAHTATRILKGEGFEAVRNLSGGMLMRRHRYPEEFAGGEPQSNR